MVQEVAVALIRHVRRVAKVVWVPQALRKRLGSVRNPKKAVA